MRRIIAAAGVCAIGLAGVLAEERPAAPPTAKPAAAPAVPVVKLVEQLSSRDYKAREAAGKALEARGTEALPALRKALDAAPSAEARKRLAALVEKLERAEILSPKRLTLKMRERPIAEVIKEVAKQTGYPIQFQGGNNVNVTVEVEKATFWEVMDQVCNSTGMVMHHNEPNGWVLYSNEGYWPHVHYAGPFKVIASNFSYNKTVNFGPIQRNPANNQLRNESLTFSFNLHAEPKLPLMSVGQVRLIEAVDELGNSMKPDSPPHEAGYPNHNGYRTFQHGASLNLLWPNKEARSLKRLRGVIPVTLLGEQKPEVVIEDVLKVKGKKFVGSSAELTVEEVKEQNNKTQYHVKMSVRNTAANANQDYSWTNSVHQRIELHDAKGNRYVAQGYNWENSSPAHVQATFMFGTSGNATLGPPAKLVYNHWALMQHSIEFEFKNLTLP